MQPGRRNAPVRPVLFGIFGQPEAEPRVEIHGVLHFGGEHVEMVEPLRMAALVEVVAPQMMRALVHRGIELDLEAEGIGELQRAALERLLGEGVDDAVLREERGGLVEIVVVADLEAEPVAGGRLRLPQHQRVMLMLLAAAQVDGIVVAVLDMQADRVLIERAARVQVGDVEHRMAGADDVERRIENVLRNGHGVSSMSPPSFRDGAKHRDPESRDSGFATLRRAPE